VIEREIGQGSRVSVHGWDGRSARAFAVVVAGLVIIAGWWWWSGRAHVPAAVSQVIAEGVPWAGGGEQSASGQGQSAEQSALPSRAGDAPQLVVVHVAGAVRSPGLVELPWGSRVSDAVAAAGGAVSPDLLTSVNLARPLIDGEQILVGAVGADQEDGRISVNTASSV
jgi:competence protein ComEA